ncbi:MAG TPA: hypothetical protein PLJ35_04325 [Anaerolineae bacterium]|mgnify:CR=1 FL=1|nr:hypothetical protein [Anaerolineae bacterium]HPL28530.1 hypothetical protein [Anaerolineae bacterium]
MESTTRLVKLAVFSPLTEVTINRGNAPRLDTLNGKTIGEVWTTGHYGADRTFPIIRRKLQERFPDVKIVPYTEFAIGKPNISQRWAPLDQVAEILRAKGCDAVLLGNGG